jgi:hypothetical protein
MKRVVVFVLLCNVLLYACKNNGKNETADHRKPANETEEHIYNAADSMMAAFKNRDWPTFVRFNHPAMTNLMGGNDNFISFIQLQMKQIPDTAVKYIGAGNILQVVTTDKDQQCVVEQNMKLVMDSIQITSTSYLVGESLDNGKTWKFFDASNSGLITAKDIKPNLSPELKIPAKKQESKLLQ